MNNSHPIIKHTMNWQEWLMLLLLSVLWGCSFFFVEVAVTVLPPLTIVSLRLSLAAITLWLVLFMRGYQLPKDKQLWISFFKMGLLNNAIPFSLIVWGQVHIASGLASILNAATPFFTVIVAGLVLSDEHFTWRKVCGSLVGLTGVIILIGWSLIDTMELSNSIYVLAQLAILGAALSYSFANVYGRRFRTMKIDVLICAAGQVTASAIILLPVSLFFEQPWQLDMPNLSVVFSVFCLAVFSTALAYLIYFKLLATAGASNVALVTLLVPISALCLGILFLDEQLMINHLMGMIFIGFGLSIVDGRVWQYMSRLRRKNF